MSRYVPEVSGYTDHPHAPLGTNLSTPSRGKLPRLLSRGMFTMSIRDNAISNFLFISQICHGCSGSRDTKLRCVSLDCPVFYKLVQCTRDLRSSEHFRKILDSL